MASNESQQTNLLGQATESSSASEQSVASDQSKATETSSSSATVESSSASTENKSADADQAPKKPASKKFHQETIKAPSGNKYLVTFPGMQKAMKLQSENSSSPEAMHRMFMNNLLEGKYSYKYFDDLDDGISREKSVTVYEDDGSEETYHIKIQSFRQLDEVIYNAINDNGLADPYKLASYAFDNLVEEDVSFDYFDTHSGMSEIIDATNDLITDLNNNSEFSIVMIGVRNFLDKMFR